MKFSLILVHPELSSMIRNGGQFTEDMVSKKMCKELMEHHEEKCKKTLMLPGTFKS